MTDYERKKISEVLNRIVSNMQRVIDSIQDSTVTVPPALIWKTAVESQKLARRELDNLGGKSLSSFVFPSFD